MEIVNNSTDYDVAITAIDLGECFVYKECLHMKVSDGSIDREGAEDFPNVVINLETNRLNAIRDSVKVKRVKAKVVVE